MNNTIDSVADLGAPVECRVGQNFDKFWTNVQVLSNICPAFVQVLSMSNICQNNWNFTKFCQKFVKILSKNYVICPKIVKEICLCPILLVLDKPWTIKCQAFCPSLVYFILVLSDKITCPNFVKVLSMSNFCLNFVKKQFQIVFVQYLSTNKKCPIFVQHLSRLFGVTTILQEHQSELKCVFTINYHFPFYASSHST